MTRNELRNTVIEELTDVAPDIDASEVRDDVDLQAEYDLDSMDTVNLVSALHKRLGVNIPDKDYARMRTITDLLDYLERRFTEQQT